MSRTLPVLLLAGCIVAPAGAADGRAGEALGAVPIDPDGGSRRSPRDLALRRAGANNRQTDGQKGCFSEIAHAENCPKMGYM